MPEELTGTDQGMASAAASPPGGAAADTGSLQSGSASAPSASSAASTGSGGAGGAADGTSEAAPAPGTAAAAEYTGIRDAARQYGYEVPDQFQDDHALLNHLILQARQSEQLQAQLRQAQQYAEHGRRYLQHAGPFEQYLAEQARQKQQQTPAEPWFKAPEYDPAWRAKLTRDPQTGEIRPVQGAAPDLVNKYHAAVEHRENFLDKFAFDPIGAIKPGIEEVVRSLAGELVQQELGRYQSGQQAQQIIAQNSGWLYARDAQGRPVTSAQGQPQLSEHGQVYYGYAQHAATKMGLADQEQIHEYALAMLQRDVAIQRLQQIRNGPPTGAQAVAGAATPAPAAPVTPAEQGAAAKQGFLEQARQGSAAQQRRPGHGGSVNGKGPQNPSLSLEEMLRQRFKEAGVTDQAVRDTLKPARR